MRNIKIHISGPRLQMHMEEDQKNKRKILLKQLENINIKVQYLVRVRIIIIMDIFMKDHKEKILDVSKKLKK
jgi:hypothetical protein